MSTPRSSAQFRALDSLKSGIKRWIIVRSFGDMFDGFIGFDLSNFTRWAPDLRHSNRWSYALMSAVVIHSILWAVPAGAIEIPPFYPFYQYNCCAGAPTILPMVDRGTSRYQQVFDSSIFTLGIRGSAIPPEGAFLTVLLYRSSCDSRLGWYLTNLQINASTTLRKPDELSSVFAENVGSDDVKILGPVNTVLYTDSATCSRDVDSFNTQGDRRLDFSFFYSPSKGNLLLDFRNNGSYFDWAGSPPGGPGPDDARFDGSSNRIDGVSLVFAPSVNATEATLVDTGGFAVGFIFRPIPKLHASYQTNHLVLLWPTHPHEFKLQAASKLEKPVSWKDVTAELYEDSELRAVAIPVSSPLGSSHYYRLYWNTPQPGVDPRSTGGAP